MSTTYGSLPGVEITVRGVAITGIIVGREQKLVVFGNGDTTNGEASNGSLTQVNGRADADTKFGSGTELADNLRHAIDNGAKTVSDGGDHLLYAVAPTETAVTAEQVTQSATLANAPIVEDPSLVTVTDTTSGDLDVEFRHSSPPSTPSAADTAYINPHSGEIEADAAADGSYEVDYTYLEWSNAFDAADGALNEKETGIYAALTEAESVVSDLVTKINNLRDPSFKLVRGLAGAQPNASADGSEENLAAGDAKLDVSTYSDNIDDDSMYLLGPSRDDGTTDSLIGAAAGVFAGHELDNPVYKEGLSGVTPSQRLNKSDRDTLRDQHQVIAVSRESSVELHSNTSTSTKTDWERDFHRVRIVDQTILIAKEVGDNIEGDLNDPNTQATAKAEVSGQIENLINDGLLEPNNPDSESWYVDVIEPSQDEVAIEMGIKPEGVVKNVDVVIDVEA